VAVVVTAVALAGCEPSPPAHTVTPIDAPFSVMMTSSKAGQWRAVGDERIEVWVCHVPLDTTARIYGGLQIRRSFTPSQLVAAISTRVPAYFDAISHGRYRPQFVVGGEFDLQRTDVPQACADHAIAAAAAATRAVLLVADAEHGADQPGGIGSAGVPCVASGPCPVAQSKRWAYVGAADFSPDWGDRPPMDLIEHELGHTLGWVHSGTPPTAHEGGDYDSALDVMSNSAAPREVDPSRRDAPDTLAVDRVECGWLQSGDIVVADATGGTTNAVLAPSTGASGIRLMVLPVDSSSFLTVELLTRSGFNTHLPVDGVAVHLVTVAAAQLDHVTPVLSKPPYTDLIVVGATRQWQMWKVSVADGWKVTATHVGA
jgi:hypothetical protein